MTPIFFFLGAAYVASFAIVVRSYFKAPVVEQISEPTDDFELRNGALHGSSRAHFSRRAFRSSRMVGRASALRAKHAGC